MASKQVDMSSPEQIDARPVIMAGGSGTRLWPLSRAQHPKQFLVLQGNQSLFQQAAARLASLKADDIRVAPPCVVGNEEHRFLILDQLRELKLPEGKVVVEPVGRNPAPAMTLAALHASEHGGAPVLVVTPALPVKNVREFIALAKKRPGELTSASSGVGSTGHVAAEMLCR